MNPAFRLPLILSLCLSHSLAAVRVEDVPEKGVQPEVATDGNGIVHLVYLRGDAKASEVRYTFRKPGEPWQKSQTVNSRPGSAVALGSIRGPQLTLGQGGAVHVLWNGTDSEKTGRSPLWYARRAANGADFAPQQDLLGEATALDGGASMASDAKGRVFVVWHGNAAGVKPEESQRLIFLRVSSDDGSTFKEAEPVNPASPHVLCLLFIEGAAQRGGRTSNLCPQRGDDGASRHDFVCAQRWALGYARSRAVEYRGLPDEFRSPCRERAASAGGVGNRRHNTCGLAGCGGRQIRRDDSSQSSEASCHRSQFQRGRARGMGGGKRRESWWPGVLAGAGQESAPGGRKRRRGRSAALGACGRLC